MQHQIIWGTHEDEVGQSIGKWYFTKIRKPNYDVESIFCAMGILDDTKTLRGAVIFNHYNHFNIEIHYWGYPGAVTAKTWREVLRFVFERLKVVRLSAITNRGNKKLTSQLPRLGFKYEASLKRFYGVDSKSQDAIVYVLFKEEADRILKNGRR